MFLVVSSTAWAAPATAQSLEQKLIDMAPVLSSGDKAIQSLDLQVVLSLPQGPPLSIRTLYKAPDRFAAYVCDARDGTPLFAAAQGRMLMYDPGEGALRETKSAPQFEFVQKEKLSLNFGWSADKPPSVLMDLSSLIRAAVKSSARELGGGRYLLTQTTRRGNVQESEIDQARAFGFTRVRLVNAMELYPLRVNEPIDESLLSLPPAEKLQSEFTVLTWPAPIAEANAQGIQAFAQLAVIRMAALNPQEQAKLGQKLPGVDWEKVRSNDARYAPRLRELFPGAMVAEPASTKPAEAR
jgi:hypothetical protein